MTAQSLDDTVETPEVPNDEELSLPWNPLGAERLGDDALEEGNILWLKNKQSCDLPEYAHYEFGWGVCQHPVMVLLFDNPDVWVCAVSAAACPRLS